MPALYNIYKFLNIIIRAVEALHFFNRINACINFFHHTLTHTIFVYMLTGLLSDVAAVWMAHTDELT